MNLDDDVTESQEWLDALKAVQVHRGADRSNYLISRLLDPVPPRQSRHPKKGIHRGQATTRHGSSVESPRCAVRHLPG